MRHTAIVVLVLAAFAAGCSQPADQSSAQNPAPAGTPASAQDGAATAGASASAPGGATTTALNGVNATTPAGAAGAGSAPAVNEVTVPAGTPLAIVLESAVSSESSRVDQPVAGHLASSVEVGGVAVLPAGSPVHGVVTEVYRAGKVKGRAEIAFRFTELSRAGESDKYTIKTPAISRVAQATKKKDAMKVGGGALGGAVVGGLIGGKKGAAVGTAAGAGAGGAVVMSTRGDEVRLAEGAKVNVKLTEPLVVRVPAH